MLEVCKKYGAVAVALPADDKGWANSHEVRKELLLKICERAEALSLCREDMLLCLPAPADAGEEAQTLMTLEWAQGEGFGTAVRLLGERAEMSASFLEKAVPMGLCASIV